VNINNGLLCGFQVVLSIFYERRIVFMTFRRADAKKNKLDNRLNMCSEFLRPF